MILHSIIFVLKEFKSRVIIAARDIKGGKTDLRIKFFPPEVNLSQKL